MRATSVWYKVGHQCSPKCAGTIGYYWPPQHVVNSLQQSATDGTIGVENFRRLDIDPPENVEKKHTAVLSISPDNCACFCESRHMSHR
jgi:hypothetical protein